MRTDLTAQMDSKAPFKAHEIKEPACCFSRSSPNALHDGMTPQQIRSSVGFELRGEYKNESDHVSLFWGLRDWSVPWGMSQWAGCCLCGSFFGFCCGCLTCPFACIEDYDPFGCWTTRSGLCATQCNIRYFQTQIAIVLEEKAGSTIVKIVDDYGTDIAQMDTWGPMWSAALLREMLMEQRNSQHKMTFLQARGVLNSTYATMKVKWDASNQNLKTFFGPQDVSRT
jgi:hypothetical protein